MTDATISPLEKPARQLQIALGLFFATGASALIYQTVWMRMLVRAFGVTVWATTTVVAVFMAGLALGALLASRFADRGPTLARWGRVEVGVALAAIAATAAISGLPTVWTGLAASLEPAPLAVARVLLAAACLLPPTTLMGMTLPMLVAAWPARRALPLLYGANTLGAVGGAIAVGFVLLAVFGERGSILCAVALNLGAGVAALRLGVVPSQHEEEPAPAADVKVDRAPMLIGLIVAGAIGFVMLGLEIAWTRLLVFVVGSSTYAFTSMIAMYLSGIGLGGLLASRRPVVAPAAIAAAILSLTTLILISLRVYGAVVSTRVGAEYTYSPLTGPGDIVMFFVSCAVVVGPATIVSGLVFPWLAAHTGAAGGAAAGRLYAANATGSVLGALAVGFGIIAWLGPWGAVFSMAVLATASGAVFALVTGAIRSKVVLGAAAVAVLAMATAPTEDVTRDVVADRARNIGFFVVHHVDAIDTTISVLQPMNGNKAGASLMINSIMTSTVGRASELMAHLPLALVDHPESALVICFGVGGTFTAATQHVDTVHGVELVDEVVKAFPLFGGDPALLSAKSNRVFIADGRNHLLASDNKYDAIVIDAAPPIYGAGTVNLYSSEMMALSARRLTDKGVFLLWLPTQTWFDDVWSAIRGVADSFEHVAIIAPRGSGILVLGSRRPLDLSPTHAVTRLADRPQIDESVARSVASILTPTSAVRIIDDAEVRRRAASHPPLTDDSPLTEFPLMHLLRHEPLIRQGIDFLE